MFLGYYNYTTKLTYISVGIGVLGMFFALDGHYPQAMAVLLLCGFIDMIDGKVAATKKNRTEKEKAYGVQIDSLADMVNFGILPALIGYALGLERWYFYIILVVYVIATLIRLAYFNVIEEERVKSGDTSNRTYYNGLPVTMAGMIFPLLFCFYTLFDSSTDLFAHFYAGLLVLTAFAFLFGKWKVPKARGIGLFVMSAIGLVQIIVIFYFFFSTR